MPTKTALPTILLSAVAAVLLGACAAPSSPPATAPPSAPEAPPPAVPAEPVPGAGPEAQPPVEPPGGPPPAAVPAAEPAPPPATVVAETWETGGRPAESLRAVAVWHGRGDRPWLLATAAGTDRLLLFDAETGEPLREVGSSGDGAGRFRRPAGMAVADDLAFVVERDNARVQVLRLPGLSTAGFVGVGLLVRPAGVTVFRRGDAYHLYVSDDYPAAAAGGGAPDLTRRVHHYRVDAVSTAGAAAELRGELMRTFGAADGPGALHRVAALSADPARGHLLVAGTDHGGAGLWVYGLDGAFQGRVIAGSVGGPVGVALYPCADLGGYWIVTDGAPRGAEERGVFRVLNRGDFEALGRFTGRHAADTAGVWLTTVPTPAFPAGALYAVNDDESVTAFDWGAVADALGLRSDCAAAPR